MNEWVDIASHQLEQSHPMVVNLFINERDVKQTKVTTNFNQFPTDEKKNTSLEGPRHIVETMAVYLPSRSSSISTTPGS